jgi:hypothetical protein
MAYWFLMCLSDEGHIRVSTLSNHMKQSNAFTKCWLEEEHLPEWEALGPCGRFFRLISYLLVMLTVSSHIAMMGMSTIEQKNLARQACHKHCQVR